MITNSYRKKCHIPTSNDYHHIYACICVLVSLYFYLSCVYITLSFTTSFFLPRHFESLKHTSNYFFLYFPSLLFRFLFLFLACQTNTLTSFIFCTVFFCLFILQLELYIFVWMRTTVMNLKNHNCLSHTYTHTHKRAHTQVCMPA